MTTYDKRHEKDANFDRLGIGSAVGKAIARPMACRFFGVVTAVAVSLGMTVSTESFAQSYPSKPVRIIVPQSAGGLVDILARSMAQELTKIWGQPVIVDNKPGANTIIGSDLAAKSAADGYTLLLSNSAAISINQFLYKKLPYDPEREFTPVFSVAASPYIVIVNSSMAVNNLQDLATLAKSKPGGVTYGSFGLGSSSHIETEVLSTRMGIKMTNIPYKGIADVLPALARGEIQVALSGIPPAMPLIRSNKIKAIASTTSQRDQALPEVPTADEAGFPGATLQGWFGIVVPSATPKAIVDKIASDLAKIYSDKGFREKTITRAGLVPLLEGPEPFAEFVHKERARYSSTIKALNLSLD